VTLVPVPECVTDPVGCCFEQVLPLALVERPALKFEPEDRVMLKAPAEVVVEGVSRLRPSWREPSQDAAACTRDGHDELVGCEFIGLESSRWHPFGELGLGVDRHARGVDEDK